MKLKQLLLASGVVLLYSSVFAMDADIPEYDNESITPTTWREADLTYVTSVGGESCVQTANILRPITWLNKRNLNKNNIGKYIRLTKDDIDVDADVKLIAIKPVIFSFDEKDASKSTKRPVIGRFKRCSTNVTDYTFEDIKIGKLETIQATTEHLFYSIDRRDYIPIGQIWQESSKHNNKEHIQTETSSKSVVLVNAKSHNRNVEIVYNFEVYKSHNYFVSNELILVHNTCGAIHSDSHTADLSHFNFSHKKEYSNITFEDQTKLVKEIFLLNEINNVDPDNIFYIMAEKTGNRSSRGFIMDSEHIVGPENIVNFLKNKTKYKEGTPLCFLVCNLADENPASFETVKSHVYNPNNIPDTELPTLNQIAKRINAPVFASTHPVHFFSSAVSDNVLHIKFDQMEDAKHFKIFTKDSYHESIMKLRAEMDIH